MSQWTKPKDIMRNRNQLKTRASEVGKRKGAYVTRTLKKGFSGSDVTPCGDFDRKRKNPFSVRSTDSGRKHAISAADEDVDAGSSDEELFADSPEPDDKRKKFRLFSALTIANMKQQEGDSTSKGKQRKPPHCRKVLVKSFSFWSPGTAAKEESDARQRSLDKGEGGGEGRRGSSGVVETAITPQADYPNSEDDQSDQAMPTDWSLKVKLRVVFLKDLPIPSPGAAGQVPASVTAHDSPFPLTGSQRQVDLKQFMLMEPSVDRKARSMWGFVHNLPLPEGCTATGDRDSVLLWLRQCCHHWVFPSLPGFAAFPRIAGLTSARDQAASLLLGDRQDLQTTLFSSWQESFGSVYQLLRTGRCVYFYVCCPNFTVLFHNPTPLGKRLRRLSAGMLMSACITPTTRGLRQAMIREGVEFSLPYTMVATSKGTQETSGIRKKQQSTDQTKDDGNNTDDDEYDVYGDILSTDEGASRWLKDVGLDQKNFPSLQPSRIRIQLEGYERVDGRAESLVRCEGQSSVHALYNFLINSPRILTELTGPQAGFPPSILSPVPFLGATLKNNHIQHSVARVGNEARQVLEVSGPLMPHHLLGITNFLRTCSHLSTDLILNTHPPTTPFNLPPKHPPPSTPNTPNTPTNTPNHPSTTHTPNLLLGITSSMPTTTTHAPNLSPTTKLSPTHCTPNPSPTTTTSGKPKTNRRGSKRKNVNHSVSPERNTSCATDMSVQGMRDLETETSVDDSQKKGIECFTVVSQGENDTAGSSSGFGSGSGSGSDSESVCYGGHGASVWHQLCSPAAMLTPSTAVRKIQCHHGRLRWSS